MACAYSFGNTQGPESKPDHATSLEAEMTVALAAVALTVVIAVTQQRPRICSGSYRLPE